MELVSRDDVRQRSHRYFGIVRDAAAAPRLFVQVFEQKYGGPPHGFELVGEL